MLRPYLAIFRQLFTFLNRRTALDLKSVYIHATALSLFTLKCVCLRIKLSLRYALFPFIGVHVYAPFVCMFSLIGHMSLVSKSE
jgi:uncharacterized protein (DUF2062 family)